MKRFKQVFIAVWMLSVLSVGALAMAQAPMLPQKQPVAGTNTIDLPPMSGSKTEDNTAAYEPNKPVADAPVDEDTYAEEPQAPSAPNLAAGEAGRGNVVDIDQYWQQQGYPDKVSFAHQAGGEVLDNGTVVSWWEIGVVGGDEQTKQAVLDCMDASCRVTFVDTQYSYGQRKAAYDDLLATGDEGILQVIMTRNAEHVVVVVTPAEQAAYTERLTLQYGSLIQVTTEIGIEDELVINPPGGKQEIAIEPQDPGVSEQELPWGGGPILFGIVCAAAMLWFAGRTRAMQTTAGTIVTQGEGMTKAAVVQAVKESTAEPQPDALQSIWNKLQQ